MKKNIIVHVVGNLGQDNSSEETIEVYTTGIYNKKNDKHFLLYDEDLGDGYGIVHNVIKISENPLIVTVIKKGAMQSHMVFEMGEEKMSVYQTPFGTLNMNVKTQEVKFKEETDYMVIRICYTLEMNFEQLSKNNLLIEIHQTQE